MYRFVTNASSSYYKRKLHCNRSSDLIQQSFLRRCNSSNNNNHHVHHKSTNASSITLKEQTLKEQTLKSSGSKILNRDALLLQRKQQRILLHPTNSIHNTTMIRSSNNNMMNNDKKLFYHTSRMKQNNNSSTATTTTNTNETSPIKESPKNIDSSVISSIESEMQLLTNFYRALLNNHQSFDISKNINYFKIPRSDTNSVTRWYCECMCPITHVKFTMLNDKKKSSRKELGNTMLYYWDNFLEQYYNIIYHVNVNDYFTYKSIDVNLSGGSNDMVAMHACEFTCPITKKVFKSHAGYYKDPSANYTTTANTPASYYATKLTSKRSMYNQVISSLLQENNNAQNKNIMLFINLLYMNSISLSTSLPYNIYPLTPKLQVDFKCPFSNKHIAKTIVLQSNNVSDNNRLQLLYENKEFWNIVDNHWKKLIIENIHNDSKDYDNNSNGIISFETFDDHFTYTPSAVNMPVGAVNNENNKSLQWIHPITNKRYACSSSDATGNNDDSIISLDNMKRNITWQILMDKQNDNYTIQQQDTNDIMTTFNKDATTTNNNTTTASQQQESSIAANDMVEQQAEILSLTKEINKFYSPYNNDNKSFIESISITKDKDENDRMVYKGEYKCPIINEYITATIPIEEKQDNNDANTNINEMLYDQISTQLISSWKNNIQKIYQRYVGVSNIFNWFTYGGGNQLWTCSFACPYTHKAYNSPHYSSKKKFAGYAFLPNILHDWNELVYWNIDSDSELSKFYNDILVGSASIENNEEHMIKLDDCINYETNKKINLRGDVKPCFINFKCPLTLKEYKSTTDLDLNYEKNANTNSNMVINELLFKSKEEATLNVLLQVISHFEDKILNYYNTIAKRRILRNADHSLLEDTNDMYKNFDSMCAYEILHENYWNCKFKCPITRQNYSSEGNNSKLLAKMNIMKQICINCYGHNHNDNATTIQFNLPGLDDIIKKLNVNNNNDENNIASYKTTTIDEMTDNDYNSTTIDDNDDDSSFIVQPIPTSSPMELILQAWDYDTTAPITTKTSTNNNNDHLMQGSTMPNFDNDDNEAAIKANNMLLWMTNHKKLNMNYNNKISSSSYIRLLEALSKVHSLPFKKTSPYDQDNNIILNSLTKVQTYAEKIINYRLTTSEKETINAYNLYLKCLRNPNKKKLANNAENILLSKIRYPNNDTYKILMNLWNDAGPDVCKYKNKLLMDEILNKSKENYDNDSKDSIDDKDNDDVVMIDKEILTLALKSIALSGEKIQRKDDNNNNDDDKENEDGGLDISLAKYYIEQAKLYGTNIDINILNLPIQRNWSSSDNNNNEADNSLRIAEQSDEWLDYISQNNEEPNIETYSNIMQAWCQVVQHNKIKSEYGLKRSEEIAEKILQLQQQESSNLSSNSSSKIFHPLLKAYANNTSINEDNACSIIHNGLLNRIEKWSNKIGIHNTGYYAIMAWCNHFEKCLLQNKDKYYLQETYEWKEILNCAHNCKDWTLQLLENYNDDNSNNNNVDNYDNTAIIDYALIGHVLKIWGNEDILKSLPQDGKEIITKLLDCIIHKKLQPKNNKGPITNTDYNVLKELMDAINNINLVNDNNINGMDHNGFNFLFPAIERLLYELDNNKSSSMNNDYATITCDDKDNDTKAKLQFYKSILKGCNTLTNDKSHQGDAIRMTMKVLHRVLSLSSEQYQKEYIEQDVREVMKDILSISNNLKDSNDPFLDKVFDIIISSSNDDSSKNSQHLMKLCLDVMAEAKRSGNYSNSNRRKYYSSNSRRNNNRRNFNDDAYRYDGAINSGRNRRRVGNKGSVME